jgi:hypothetical protein
MRREKREEGKPINDSVALSPTLPFFFVFVFFLMRALVSSTQKSRTSDASLRMNPVYAHYDISFSCVSKARRLTYMRVSEKNRPDERSSIFESLLALEKIHQVE